MIIEFDDREGKAVEGMMLLVDEKIVMMRKRLEEGDYVNGDVCIERKEINDFCNSIMDGRMDKQIEKMKKKYKYSYVIIVGKMKDRIVEIHENCVLGMISKLCVNGISVGMVDDEFQFFYLMKRIFERHKEIEDKKYINKQVKKIEDANEY